jgi:hypothetical protein
MMMPKELILPREFYDRLKEAKPLNLKDYESLGSVEHHNSIDSVIKKMIAKQEQVTGRLINQEEPKKEYNLKGINDDRKDRNFFNVGTHES